MNEWFAIYNIPAATGCFAWSITHLEPTVRKYGFIIGILCWIAMYPLGPFYLLWEFYRITRKWRDRDDL